MKMRRRDLVIAVFAGAGFVALVAMITKRLQPGAGLDQTELAHVVAMVAQLDQVQLEVTPPLDSSRVDIYWHLTAEPQNARQIVSGGVLVAPVPRGYGENDVEFRYDGQRVATIRQFKTAWWHYHHYRIALAPNRAGRPAASLSAVGVDRVD